MITLFDPATGPRLRGHWPFALALFFVLLPLGAGPQGATEGSGLRQFVLVLLFLAGAFTIARFPDRWAWLGKAMPLALLGLLTYSLMSALWSPERFVSFKRVVQLAGVAVLGMALLIGGDGRARLLRVVEPVLWVGMLLTVVWTAASPTFAFADNGFRGFMATKNSFAQFSAICVLVPIALLHTQPGRHRGWRLLLALVGLAGVALSRSATVALTLGIIAMGYVIVRALHRLHRSWLVISAAILMIGITVAFALGVFYGFPSLEQALGGLARLVGRDITLTGRAYLWELMIGEVAKHPWFGIGYGGFWLGLEGDSGQVAYLVKWGYPGQAHNGYLDILNELGTVGVLLLGWLLIQHAQAITRLHVDDPAQAWFHAGLFFMVLVLNFAEAALLRTTHFWWTLLVASMFEVRWLAFGSRAAQPMLHSMTRRDVPA